MELVILMHFHLPHWVAGIEKAFLKCGIIFEETVTNPLNIKKLFPIKKQSGDIVIIWTFFSVLGAIYRRRNSRKGSHPWGGVGGREILLEEMLHLLI